MKQITIRSKRTNKTETYSMEDPILVLNKMQDFSRETGDYSIYLVNESEEKIKLLYIYDKWIFVSSFALDVFERALSIIRRTEITSNYFLKEKNFLNFPCSSMFSLIGAMSYDFRDVRGNYDPNSKMKQLWLQYIDSDKFQIKEDSILEAETEGEAAYVFMYRVIKNLESGHIKLRE